MASVEQNILQNLAEQGKNPKAAFGSKKPPASTIPRPVLWELGVAMLEGGIKYSRHNYRVTRIKASDYMDACNRHMDYWWEGEDIDPDSGLNHITKAIATLVVLRDAMIHGSFEDDRPPKANVSKVREFLERVIRGLFQKYPNPKEPVTSKGTEGKYDYAGRAREAQSERGAENAG